MKGFTIIELLLSVALVGALAIFSFPVYQSFQSRSDGENAAVIVAQTMRRAQALSHAMDGDMSWGVKIQGGSIVLFKGETYASRDTTTDEVFDMPSDITPSGANEIVFEKFSGLPQSTGTVTLTSNTNETRNITINAQGTITY
ncbi:type II secretion system protein [Candidatus Uhrbacteria bacterium]|nr:type II secretion system protein [Candidatus Uhrbacteria bacterium]